MLADVGSNIPMFQLFPASIKRGYAGMTSDCAVGGLCEIFMRD